MTNPFSKLTHSQKEILSRIILAMFGVWFLWAIAFNAVVKPNQMRSHGRYTVATTGDQYLVLKSGMKVRYHYYVNGERYDDRFGKTDHIKPHGEKYLIRFSSKDPSINEIVYIKPVPEKFHNPPPEGWEKPPYYDTNVTLDNSKVGSMPVSCVFRHWLFGRECPKCRNR